MNVAEKSRQAVSRCHRGRLALAGWLVAAALLAGAVDRPVATAQEELQGTVPSQPSGRLELTLREAILTALAHNLDIRMERFTPLIREAEILQALGDFDTTFFLDSTLRREKSPPTIVFVGGAPQQPAGMTDTFSLSFGLTRKLSTGATVELSYDNVRTANPPAPGIQNAAVGLEVTQPLLRGGWWTVNLSDVRIARNSRRASLYDFQMAVMEVIAEVERAYWGLVFAYGDLTVRERSLELAEELLESNRQRVEAEILAPSEIVRAESSVAARQASILDAQTAVHDAEDTLRRLMNPPDSELTDDLTVVPVDEPPKDYQPVDGKRAICQALTNRPDFIAQKTDVENLGIDLVLSRNELLPTLDLTLFYRSKGAGRSLDSSFDRYSSFLFDDFGATIEFAVPLEQRTAKGAVTEARLALQQSLLELKDTEDAIVVEVRRQLRRVRAKHELITRFHWAWELAGKRLNAEDEKLLLGTATTLDVLEAQRELSTAERDELRASVDFNIALVDLRRATGSLLTDYQVHFSDR